MTNESRAQSTAHNSTSFIVVTTIQKRIAEPSQFSGLLFSGTQTNNVRHHHRIHVSLFMLLKQPFFFFFFFVLIWSHRWFFSCENEFPRCQQGTFPSLHVIMFLWFVSLIAFFCDFFSYFVNGVVLIYVFWFLNSWVKVEALDWTSWNCNWFVKKRIWVKFWFFVIDGDFFWQRNWACSGGFFQRFHWLQLHC